LAHNEYEFDAARVRQEIARCARDFFIASEGPPAHDDLVLLIGENADMVSRERLDELIAGATRE
jgi:hypothetical protein